ncbi:MAG: CHAT domain-containing protein, partial [Polyangiaceae bacterium]|nr:CHAT domain-containing protein [Polyangiaceae bacterium]
ALTAKQAELAALREAARPEQADAVRALADEVDRREAELSRTSVAFRTQATPVTVEQVQAALPDDAALVEFVRYQRFDPKDAADRWKEWRYVAYVLRRAGPPRWADLGEAAPLEDAVRRWAELGEAAPLEDAVRVASAALARPAADTRTPLRDLDTRLLAPVRRVLGSLPKHLLVAPDADLHLVPFGALVDEGGHHLLERALVTQLGSGRDLLRLREQTAPRAGPLLVADPAFGPYGPAGSFRPLPATAAEAEAVHAVFPALVPQTGLRATKDVLARTHGPRFVLVATHGLLGRTAALAPAASGGRAPAAASGGQGAKSGAALASALRSPDGPDPEEALDQAALAFAGANARPDALLTARELAGVDLYGTKLVVLSACETGLGRIATGEGVYGLRRALTIAGAESQVTSLWRVDDGSTAQLMGSYFGALRDGVGRSQALRQAQLGLLKQERYRHPYYWAAFVASGDWRPLDGRDPPPPVPHGGCICAIVEARPQSSAPWVLTLLPLGWLRRRKRSSVSRG